MEPMVEQQIRMLPLSAEAGGSYVGDRLSIMWEIFHHMRSPACMKPKFLLRPLLIRFMSSPFGLI
jgi:hypothetical protein